MYSILAIENSTNYLSIAYSINKDSLKENFYHENHQNNASKYILEKIQQCLKGSIPQYIAVGIGPGAFTGVRLACSVAMGLAISWGIKVIPICSLQSALEYFRIFNNLEYFNGRIIIDARMNEVYTAKFNLDNIWHLQEIELLDIKTIFDDNLILSNISQINTNINNIKHAQPHALGVLSLSFDNTDKAVLPQYITPNYVRNKVAYTIAERTS